MTDVATAVRQLLATAPEKTLPMTYQQVAAALGLTPPRTIQRVAQALEQLMRDDAASHRPFIAALVVSRRGENMPAAGFFEQAVALGRFPAHPIQHTEAYRAEYQQALASRSNA
ncbi:MAG: hypothetical protein ACTIDY_08465 [Halomonadaceae bacterium]|uniref:Uncharacterized protein n=1 Tax=Halomonas colorata TaxID=2742615 RepID=A0ABR9FUT4_9GAMM|nr:hypothetical protein [Halomonas colorata]MBE0462406.1 hypothetical protein [Halomonas colorata]